MWINTIAKCRDRLIRLNAEREQFVNFDDVSSVLPRCFEIKIGDYNISEEGDIITIPHYLTFVLGKIKYDF